MKRYKEYEEMTELQKRRIINEALYQMRCPGRHSPHPLSGLGRAVLAVETPEHIQWRKDNNLMY